MPWHDYDDDEFDDVEVPEEEMHADDSDKETKPCPYCREPIYDDTVRCPHCGNYLSREDAPLRRPTWMIVGALICLVVAVMWALGRW
jgi:predicted nucleic acid-binding Zn ribbon protein